MTDEPGLFSPTSAFQPPGDLLPPATPVGRIEYDKAQYFKQIVEKLQFALDTLGSLGPEVVPAEDDIRDALEIAREHSS